MEKGRMRAIRGSRKWRKKLHFSHHHEVRILLGANSSDFSFAIKLEKLFFCISTSRSIFHFSRSRSYLLAPSYSSRAIYFHRGYEEWKGTSTLSFALTLSLRLAHNNDDDTNEKKTPARFSWKRNINKNKNNVELHHERMSLILCCFYVINVEMIFIFGSL